MYIYNIQCDYTEYRKLDTEWELYTKSKTIVDTNFIQNMVAAGSYFRSMGGTQDLEMKRNRRFGMQVSSITCISFCGSIRKEFVFNYNNAKHIS